MNHPLAQELLNSTISARLAYIRPDGSPHAIPIGFPGTHAVIVGISKYRLFPKWNLEYADRDARDLAKLIRTPSGGGFQDDHVRELINGKATTTNIVKALRGFLQKPARDDLVLIYFACHGVQDANRPGNL